ncbi:MAG: L-seryl-tRNA(Sec) selenium transferase [Desulfobacterales bacterium]
MNRDADFSPEERQERLRRLPAVDRLLETARGNPDFAGVPPSVLTQAAREVIDAERRRLLSPEAAGDPPALSVWEQRLREAVRRRMRPNLRRVVNATGVVIHTNLGRSLLAEAALARVQEVARHYANLEYDLERGKRGSRYSAVRDLLCEITGAEDAMVVNNNAGAVLISLETLARGREVVVSRGDLVEIGGSFRIPEVMAKSGARLREVGTTNRTHLRDYESAIGAETALLLKVHWSNYSIVGFTAQVALAELVSLGRRHGLPVMEDLGSGTFVDFSRYGLLKEPTVQESVAAGADVVTFSGDKLLGGPQAGVIVGRRDLIEAIRKNPLNRALRIDKLTLAALEGTLRLYREEAEAVREIPTLRLLTESETALLPRAEALRGRLAALGDPRLAVDIRRLSSKAGGGSLPLLDLPSPGLRVRIEGLPAHRLESALRRSEPPIVVRIEEEAVIFDLRTVLPEEEAWIVAALARILGEGADSA